MAAYIYQCVMAGEDLAYWVGTVLLKVRKVDSTENPTPHPPPASRVLNQQSCPCRHCKRQPMHSLQMHIPHLVALNILHGRDLREPAIILCRFTHWSSELREHHSLSY